MQAAHGRAESRKRPVVEADGPVALQHVVGLGARGGRVPHAAPLSGRTAHAALGERNVERARGHEEALAVALPQRLVGHDAVEAAVAERLRHAGHVVHDLRGGLVQERLGAGLGDDGEAAQLIGRKGRCIVHGKYLHCLGENGSVRHGRRAPSRASAGRAGQDGRGRGPAGPRPQHSIR